MRRITALVVAGLTLSLLTSVFAASAKENLPESLTGKVVSVADGDTISILVDRTQHRIRLDGIDCPERGQPFGTRAKQATADHLFGKQVTVRVTDKDRYGRHVGRVIYQGKDERGKPVSLDLGAELVRAGLAWRYREYAPEDKDLARLEAEARKARRGLWANADAVPPWEWRRRGREASKVDKPRQDAQGAHWLNTSSGVRHNRSARRNGAVSAGRMRGSRVGYAVDETRWDAAVFECRILCHAASWLLGTFFVWIMQPLAGSRGT